MTKYLNRPALTPGQEREIFPLLDAALNLPFGKAIVHLCSKSRADYLSRILNGERYRNAIESISAYTPDDPLYGKGVYYNLVIEAHTKGLLVANVEFPPITLTWYIIECAATKKPVVVSNYADRTIQSRLCKLKERHQELATIYYDIPSKTLKYAIPSPEEMIIVDIDMGGDKIPSPSAENRAKIRR